jgi:hypothetical protein
MAWLGEIKAESARETVRGGGLVGVCSDADRLALLDKLVKADKSTPLPFGNPAAQAQMISSAQECRVKGPLTQAQYDAGLRANKICLGVGGCSHFQGWEKETPFDQEVVIVRSSAFKGKTVQLGGKWGGETWKDAAVVYYKKVAGLNHAIPITLFGQPGETVEIIYGRTKRGGSVGFTPDGAGGGITFSDACMLVGGDPHWRHVKIDVLDHTGLQPTASLNRLDHFLRDAYRGHPQGPNTWTEDMQDSTVHVFLKENGFLGGDADESLINQDGTGKVTRM